MSVNLIFGKNLRLLCKGRGSISQVAGDLGISRVQMNRILNGESFPKPGLLNRICDMFDVDGRILLQPLADVRQSASGNLPNNKAAQNALDFAMFGNDFVVGQEIAHLLPDGLFLSIRKTEGTDDYFSVVMAQMKSIDGKRVIKGYLPPGEGMRRRDLGPFRLREFRGIGLTTAKGIVVLWSSLQPTLTLGATFYSFRYFASNRLLPGYRVVFTDKTMAELKLAPMVLEPIEPTYKAILSAGRLVGVRRGDELPQKYMTYFNNPAEAWID